MRAAIPFRPFIFHLVILGICAWMFASSPVWAEADGPDFWQTGDKTAALYQSPERSAPILHHIPANTPYLFNQGCIGVPSFGEWSVMTPLERQKSKDNAWCQITFKGHKGWVGKNHLSEGAFPNTPTYNCQKAKGEIEQLICTDPTLILLDYRMKDTYQRAVNAAGRLDVGAQSAVDFLKATQRGWIKGRNECWKARDNKTQCARDSYQHRMALLQAKWMLQAVDNTQEYICNNQPAHDLHLSFYTIAPLTALSAQYGDSREIFISQDQKYYQGSFGRSLTLNDSDSLSLTWDPTKPVLSCRINK